MCEGFTIGSEKDYNGGFYKCEAHHSGRLNGAHVHDAGTAHVHDAGTPWD